MIHYIMIFNSILWVIGRAKVPVQLKSGAGPSPFETAAAAAVPGVEEGGLSSLLAAVKEKPLDQVVSKTGSSIQTVEAVAVLAGLPVAIISSESIHGKLGLGGVRLEGGGCQAKRRTRSL
jgi:hypothetical protein